MTNQQLILFDKLKLKKQECKITNCIYQKTLQKHSCYKHNNILYCKRKEVN